MKYILLMGFVLTFLGGCGGSGGSGDHQGGNTETAAGESGDENQETEPASDDHQDSEEPLATGLIADQEITAESGTLRTYDLYVPTRYQGAPVVMLFHGHGGTAAQILGREMRGGRVPPAPYKVWLEIAENENLILIVPNGYEDAAAGTKGWNDCRAGDIGNSEEDDVQLVDALLDLVITRYNADPNRVYATGSSNGGHFSIRLGLELSNRITAFAAIAATHAADTECGEATEPVSAMTVNGTADPYNPYYGGEHERGWVLSADSTIDYWVHRNGTDTLPEITAFEDIDPNDSSTVEKYSYTGGVEGTEVVLYKVTGAGHPDPSIRERYTGIAATLAGPQNGDMEMAEEVWAFFSGKAK